MRLGLSSAAAPDASIDELIEGCIRRGLVALELESGHAHGLSPASRAPAGASEARARAASVGIAIAAYRLQSPDPVEPAPSTYCADGSDILAFGRFLGAPVLADPLLAVDLAIRSGRGGGEILAVLPPGSQALAVLDTLGAYGRAGSDIGLAWDLEPGAGDVSEVAGEVLARAGARLRHVRLLGGGPESPAQEGRGVGALMVRLTLAGFSGTLALAPSSHRHRVIWSAWLGRRGGWGCGSKQEDRDLVRLVNP